MFLEGGRDHVSGGGRREEEEVGFGGVGDFLSSFVSCSPEIPIG